MKKIILLSFFGLLVLYSSGQKFHAGILAGLNGSQVAGDSYTGYNKLGFTAGGFVNYQIPMLFDVQMEIAYTQKGSRQNPDAANGNYNSYKLQTDYVEVPLFLSIGFLKLFKLELGVAGGVLINSYEEVNGISIISRPFEQINYSTVLGLSYGFANKFSVYLRATDSFTSIRKNTNSGDVYRYFGWGQWNDVLTLALRFHLK